MGASSYLSTSEVHPTRTNVNLPGMATEHSNIPEMPISHTGQDIGQVPRKGVRINVETESYMMRDIESPEDYKGDQQHAI
ncbi:hypothetical protein VKT23_006151 [Stygiomarasmius scandens]|uniref:Uncharacterized protein n=1 Tax=Marasmiellus scandens TaxID=2682957 RepID=A0ABR1JTV2_9AGAR